MRYRMLILAALVTSCGGGTSGAADRSGLAEIGLTASPEEVERLWQETMEAYRRGDYSHSLDNLERLVLEFAPGDPRVGRAYFLLGESYMGTGNELQAVRQFRKVSDERPNHPLAALALLRAGDAYAQLWRRPELDPTYGQTAMATYQELLNRYPDSDAAARGRLKIEELNEGFATKEFKTAMFYMRLKAFDSAILYLKALVADYPRTEVAPEALEQLVSAYRRLGYQEDVDETCGYMRRFHPDEPETAAACPAEDGA